MVVRGACGILRWSRQIQLRIGDAAARTFELTINFFPSKAKLVDGSIQRIERDTIVKWEVELTDIDSQVLHNMGEKAVKKWVEKIRESIVLGPEQEVSLLRFDDWKGEKKFYARCRGFDGNVKPCKWYISSRLQPDRIGARVNQIPNQHTCITSSKRVSTMASQLWVAEKIIPILAKTPNTTAKKLKIDLEKTYPIKLKYTTVWKEKQRAMKNLYGDWVNKFRMLYNFKAEVEKRSPVSVVKIDTEVSVEDEVRFSKVSMSLKPCIDGFKAGCHPYSSIDSSFLTDKWNGQLATCNALDGYNWMFPIVVGLFQSEIEASWTRFMI
ncbi:hypothetical protein D1007_46562 [Hordeum vulgare]|nr:hypothetical protein D1007_46562 [Hordeum vulgare]